MDGWNTSFLLGWPIFRGYVSFRECICSMSHINPCFLLFSPPFLRGFQITTNILVPSRELTWFPFSLGGYLLSNLLKVKAWAKVKQIPFESWGGSTLATGRLFSWKFTKIKCVQCGHRVTPVVGSGKNRGANEDDVCRFLLKVDDFLIRFHNC